MTSPEPEARGLEPEPVRVPWGYGRDRITAMVVDPVRLFVYWEVTDEAIARARARLPAAQRDAAVLAVRVYDVTGRLFDGTNAHAHVDQPVERHHRQWFFEVARPGTTAIVELGLRAPDSHFARIVRSRRAEFPRREPAPPRRPEWRTITGADWLSEPRASHTPGEAAPAPRLAWRTASPSGAGTRVPGGASEWPWTAGDA